MIDFSDAKILCDKDFPSFNCPTISYFYKLFVLFDNEYSVFFRDKNNRTIEILHTKSSKLSLYEHFDILHAKVLYSDNLNHIFFIFTLDF